MKLTPPHLHVQHVERVKWSLCYLAIAMLSIDAAGAFLRIGSAEITHGVGSLGAIIGAVVPFVERLMKQ